MSKELTGRVLSDKMEKTVVVGVERIYLHPFYQKRYRRIKKYYADDELGAKQGDQVVIKQVRPLSKLKHWKVVEIKRGKKR